MSSDRLTFKSFKKDKSDTNLKPSQSLPLRQPPNQSLVRLFKLAFPFCLVANFSISAYVFVRAKQRDDANGTPSRLKKHHSKVIDSTASSGASSSSSMEGSDGSQME